MDISNKTINQNNVPKGCIMITNLIKNKVKESSIQKIVINDSLDFDLIEDGFYTINQYFIWSEEYFNTFSIEDLNLLYNNLYVFSNNKICKYNFQINKLVPCNIQELIEINKNSKTNVKTECKDIFFIDQLKQCQLYYFNLILNKYIYKCNNKIIYSGCGCNSKQITNTDIYFKYNNICLYLDLINYYIKCKDYFAAEQLLEQYLQCFNYCKTTTTINLKECNCHG